jgi:hypothetical protein
MREVSTFISPLDVSGDLADANWIGYLIVRVVLDDPVTDRYRISTLLRRTKLVTDANGDVDSEVTRSAVVGAIEAAGFTVLSADISTGFAWLDHPDEVSDEEDTMVMPSGNDYCDLMDIRHPRPVRTPGRSLFDQDPLNDA